MKMRNLAKEQVACDIELYFYLNAEKNAWTLPVEDGYCVMSGITQDIFEELLQDYCISTDLHIVEKKRDEDSTRVEYKIKEFDRSNLLQKTIG